MVMMHTHAPVPEPPGAGRADAGRVGRLPPPELPL